MNQKDVESIKCFINSNIEKHIETPKKVVGQDENETLNEAIKTIKE